MIYFVHLLKTLPSTETIPLMWPLLEGFLPYIAYSQQGYGSWNTLEDYLSQIVEVDPLPAIQYYHAMHKNLSRLYPGKHGDKIIKMAVASSDMKAQNEALSLIDFIARRFGVHRYRNIYEEYVNKRTSI